MVTAPGQQETPRSQRLFLALPLPEPARAALAALCGGLPGVRWEPPGKLHLMLRFLGNTAPEQRTNLLARLEAERWPRVSLTLAGVGCSPPSGLPRTLWVGVAGLPDLRDLQARLEALVVALGQPPEPRPFRPHVTLARLKNLTRAQLQPYLARHGAFHLGPIEVPAFGLYASRTQPEGSVYTLEGRVPLGPPA